MKMIHLFLTCACQNEADKIASALLEKRLVTCVKMMPSVTMFHWQGSVETAQEIILMMDSEENRYDEIEHEVRKIHSYTTFVLTAVEVKRFSSGVSDWMVESLQNQKKNQ